MAVFTALADVPTGHPLALDEMNKAIQSGCRD
jgi:hypothetical protein